MRWFASTAVLAGTLLLAGAASASPDYPATIKSHLKLASVPECALCHTDGKTQVGTVTTLFGATARGTYKLTLGDAALLTSVLDKMDTDNVDSDKDSVGDIDELVAGTDPNVAGGGKVATKPELTYGCAASVAPGHPGPSSGGAFGLALVAAIGLLRRRRGLLRASCRPVIAAVVAASAAVFVGCYEVSYVTADICPTGRAWTGGDYGSPNMHPGVACIACHNNNGGPHFKIAGTIFPSNEPDDCLGASDASIEITGADGKVLTITANEAGNFYSEVDVKMPYQAKVTSGGKSKVMFGAQTVGDCNTCHTEKGANSAPGRVTLP